jgi:RNA polymerase-interacting CarD/CdnL/TRCF family regulator
MAIIIDINKAKDITKDMLRQERKPQLEALDIQMLRNFSNQELLNEIEVKKQVLRDATKQVDEMTTVDELKAASLPVLE